MPRKTNNSSQGMPKMTAHAPMADEGMKKQHQYKAETARGHVKSKRGRPPKSARRTRMTQSSSVEDEEGEADVEPDGDGDGEGDEEGNDDPKPAVLAPSARVFDAQGKQAGHYADSGEKGRDLCSQMDTAKSFTSHDQANSVMNSVEVSEQGSLVDDSDEGYAGVDLISDSEEGDGPDVERLEEQNIIESEEATRLTPLPHMLPPNESEFAAGSQPLSIPAGFAFDDDSYFDDQYPGLTSRFLGPSGIDPFNFASNFKALSPIPPVSKRRVRFTTPVLPASDDSDVMSNGEDEDITGLFKTGNHSSNEFNSRTEHINTDDTYDEENSSCGNSSGYETDCGDTTDEEDVPATATTKPQSLLRNPALSGDIGTTSTSTSMQSPFRVPRLPASLRRGPRMGTFTADPRKSRALVDETGQNMVIYLAKRPAPLQASLARIPSGKSSSLPVTPVTSHATLAAAPDLSDHDYSEMASQISADPVLSTGPNFSSVCRPNASPHQSQIGTVNASPVSSSFPFDSLMQSSGYFDEDNDDEDEAEALLNVEDFIDFGDSSSEDEDNEQRSPSIPIILSESESKNSDAVPDKTSPSSASSAHDLLKHFDTGVITAFRRGQPPAYGSHRQSSSGLALAFSAMRNVQPPLVPFSVDPSKKRKHGENLTSRENFEMATKRRLLSHQ